MSKPSNPRGPQNESWHLWLVETQPPEPGGQLSWLFPKWLARRGSGILGNEFPHTGSKRQMEHPRSIGGDEVHVCVCVCVHARVCVAKILLKLICKRAVATGLEKVSFHSNPKERKCQRMLKLLHNCTLSHTSKAMFKIVQAKFQ